jgi:membrane fusion protein, multidrug efflux system
LSKRLVVLLLVAAVLVAGAYFFIFRQGGGPAPAQNAAPANRPPPEVGVVVAQPAEVPLPVEYAGRVVGFRDVEVRPRVSGVLLKREFEEGGRVTQNQVLFRIDPAPFEVALSRAEAQLQQAQAALRQAEQNFARMQELASRQVAAERQLEDATAQRDQARASIQLAEAEIRSAKLNLDYSVVNSPAAGVTSLQSPTVGTLVQAQQTLLTTITQLDPAYVNFSFTEEEGQEFRKLNEKRAKPLTAQDLVIDLQVGLESTYRHPGKIDAAGQRVDPQTGTIQVRAIFPNPDGVLLPGQFVRVRIRGVTLPDAIVVPEPAVSQGPRGPSVYVVGENNTAEVRPVRLGPEVAAGWVIEDGLKGGERVIVDGVIRVRPGAPVRPVPMPAGSQSTQASTPAEAKPSGASP